MLRGYTVAITRNELLEKKKKERLKGMVADPLAEGFKQHAQASGYNVQNIPAGERVVSRPSLPATAQPQQPFGVARGPASPEMPWGGAMAVANRPQPMRTPAPALTSPRPEVPEQTTAAAPQTSEGPNANDIRNTILQKRRAQEINSRYQALGMTPAQGPGGQINMERADALRSMRNERDDLLGSMAPAPKVQTPEQVMSNRTNIREQGMGQVAVMRKRAFEADKAGDAETAQKLYDEARRMEVGFRTNLPDHSPESAGQIVANQEAGAQRAEARRAAYGELAAAQGNDGESLMRQQIQARERQARIDQLLQSRDESMLGGDIRENEARGRMTPQDQMARAEAMLRTKQLEAATTRQNGSVNPVEAQMRQQNRQAALGMVGLDTPEAQSSFMQRSMELGKAITAKFRAGMATPQSRAELDQILNQFDGTVLDTLEELAGMDDGIAREYASGVLNQLPQQPRLSAMSDEQMSRLSVMRKRLEMIVNPQAVSQVGGEG
jgi:hypothetical protein